MDSESKAHPHPLPLLSFLSVRGKRGRSQNEDAKGVQCGVDLLRYSDFSFYKIAKQFPPLLNFKKSVIKLALCGIRDIESYPFEV